MDETSQNGKKSMEIFQCCYTHAGRKTGAAMSAGWETVALSPNLPQEALKICKRAQNAASPNHPGIVDEQGNVLDLFETAGTGNWLCVIRTRYGQTDSLGRPSMFSHGFVFSWKDPAVLWNPNAFLSFDRDNFQTDENSAAAWNGVLRRDHTPPLSVSTALNSLSMDMSRYAVLIRCVYAQMCEGKNPKPLHIFYDGSESQLRALLYLIYGGLPGYLRKTLSVTSSANAVNLKKNLIFTPLAREKEYYLIPQTGENHFLTPRVEHRIARYSYLDYAPVHLPPENFPEYFRTLDHYAVQLGDVTASSEPVLKLAWQMTAFHEDVRELPDSELEAGLSAGLHCGMETDVFYQLMTGLLGECIRRNRFLSAETEPALEKYLHETELSAQTQAFFHQAAYYYLYQYAARAESGYENAVKFLLTLPAGTFPPEGCPEDAPAEVHELHRLWRDALEQNAYERYHATIQSPDQDNALSATDAVFACMDTVRELYPPSEAQMHTRRVRETFWRELPFNRFPFDEFSRYESLRVSTPECERAFDFAALADAFRNHPGTSPDGAFLQKVCRFFMLWNLPDTERTQLLDRLYDYLRGHSGNLPAHYAEWLTAVSLAGSEEVLKRVRNLYEASIRFQASRLIEEYPKFLNACRHAGTERLPHGTADSRNPKNISPDDNSPSRNRDAGLNLPEEYDIRIYVTALLEKICCEQDDKHHPVPLDLWLLLSECLDENCFMILDRVEAAVLTRNASQTVRESTLLKLPAYREAALHYLERFGEYSRTARWLRAAKIPSGKRSVWDSPSGNEKKSIFSLFRK